MWNRIKKWWTAQGELAKLQGVSDRMLQDMGLGREDLRRRILDSCHQAPVSPPRRVLTIAPMAQRK